ncbi:MAG: 4a-hydroxytetrahydrobiopterin dehydratase [Acidobacteria bacterium]|nr:4a-hydroxytetrahydrobiopterin dehydratase [Acidobacteriota bacterium]
MIEFTKRCTKLARVFSFPDFVLALTFTIKVGELAETEGHHLAKPSQPEPLSV